LVRKVGTEGWYERQERINYKQTSAMLTDWKKQGDLQFLNEVSCVPLQQGLRNLQKALSRKVKGSNNREKARQQVARIHA